MPNPAAGFFGKLPSAGDFVQRRLPRGFVDAWDQHFENAVAASRGTLGGAWHEAYHASPVWRFLLAPGTCGETPWLGVMGPGSDRVGRCFPMVIAAALPMDPEASRRALFDADRWCDELERLHHAAQSDAAITVDAFDESVAALAGPLDASPHVAGVPHGIDWNGASHWRLPLPAQSGHGQFLMSLWTQLAAAPGNWCVWWTAGAGRVPATALVSNGLPQPAAYAAFLDAEYSAAAWQTLAGFEPAGNWLPAAPTAMNEASAPSADIGMASPAAAWLPDDLELLSGLDTVPLPPAPAAPASNDRDEGADAVVEQAAAADHAAGIAVLHRSDCALTLVAAEVGPIDPRQRAVSAVSAVGRELAGADVAAGMQGLRAQIMALGPRLHQTSEDLIDPVMEDCAVIAARVSGGQADLLRIGTAAAWHWRSGQLRPFFADSEPPPPAGGGDDDDFNDLLFRQVRPPPGLGATAQPACGEVFCDVTAGDRLLLVATPTLVQLPPEVLARSLAMRSCDDARLHIATAADLGMDPSRWPLAIIEIDA